MNTPNENITVIQVKLTESVSKFLDNFKQFSKKCKSGVPRIELPYNFEELKEADGLETRDGKIFIPTVKSNGKNSEKFDFKKWVIKICFFEKNDF